MDSATVLMFTYVVDGILFMDILVSLRTAIVTPHGILSTFVVCYNATVSGHKSVHDGR